MKKKQISYKKYLNPKKNYSDSKLFSAEILADLLERSKPKGDEEIYEIISEEELRRNGFIEKDNGVWEREQYPSQAKLWWTVSHVSFCLL